MNEPIELLSFTLGIPVDDLEHASTWYSNLLGPRKQIDPAIGVRELELAPGVWLQFIETSRTRKVSSQSIVRIGVKDVQKEYQRVKILAKDVSPIHDIPDVIRFFEFEDPFGNRLSLYEEPE